MGPNLVELVPLQEEKEALEVSPSPPVHAEKGCARGQSKKTALYDQAARLHQKPSLMAP